MGQGPSRHIFKLTTTWCVILSLPVSAWASAVGPIPQGDSCRAALTVKTKPPQLSDKTEAPTPHKIQVSALNKTGEEGFLELVRMAGQVRNHVEAFRDIERKGEIHLGIMLKDGFSLALRYEIDSLVEPPLYRLAKIEIIQPDGHSDTLTKHPLDASGRFLFETDYEFSHELFLGDAAVFVPPVLEGEVLQRLLKISDKLEFFSAAELRGILTARDLRLFQAKFFFRDQKKFYGQRVRKQWADILLSVSAMIAINYFLGLIRDGGKKDSDPQQSELTKLLSQLTGEELNGHFNIEARLKGFRDLEEATPVVRYYVDPTSSSTHPRVISIFYFKKQEVLFVDETTYTGSTLASETALVVRKAQVGDLFDQVVGVLLSTTL